MNELQLRSENEYDESLFIRHQLHFFLALCTGRNHKSITATTSEYMSYDVLFRMMRSDEIPQDIRGLAADLIVGTSVNHKNSTPKSMVLLKKT